MRIIVLDSDIQFSNSVSQRLKKAGVFCQVFAQPAAALTELKKDPDGVDLVLISKELGGGQDGASVAEAIRKDAKMTDIPYVIMSSGWGKADFARHQKTPFGANAYFSKKSPLTELDSTIEAVTGVKLNTGGATGQTNATQATVSSLNVQLHAASDIMNVNEEVPNDISTEMPINLFPDGVPPEMVTPPGGSAAPAKPAAPAAPAKPPAAPPPTGNTTLTTPLLEMPTTGVQVEASSAPAAPAPAAAAPSPSPASAPIVVSTGNTPPKGTAVPVAPAAPAAPAAPKAEAGSGGIEINLGGGDLQIETSGRQQTEAAAPPPPAAPAAEVAAPEISLGGNAPVEAPAASGAGTDGVLEISLSGSTGNAAPEAVVVPEPGAPSMPSAPSITATSPVPEIPNDAADGATVVHTRAPAADAAPAVSEEEAAKDLPYLFAGPSAALAAGPSPASGSNATRSGIIAPTPSAAAPHVEVSAGGPLSNDVETLKKYLTMREQDVSVLTAQLTYAKEELGKYEDNIKRMTLENEDLFHQISDLKKRVSEQDQALQHADKSKEGELEQLRFEVKSKIDRIKFLEDRLTDSAQQYEKLKERVRLDIRKIRVREKELESKLEILKKDSETLIAARENKILELKRKIDLLEFNYDTLQDKNDFEKQNVVKANEKIDRVLKILKLALGVIEADGEQGAATNKEAGKGGVEAA